MIILDHQTEVKEEEKQIKNEKIKEEKRIKEEKIKNKIKVFI